MAGFQHDIAGGSGDLIINQLQSPNFSLSGQTGWAILQNGNAYFFNVTAEGTITATVFEGSDFVLNSSGQFFYSGTPAAGNLILSVTNGTGTDGKGNAYLEGTTSYKDNGTFYSAVNLNGGVAAWYVSTSAPYYGGPWVSAGGIEFTYSSGPTYSMIISGQNTISLEAQNEVTLGLSGNCVWNESNQQLSLPVGSLIINGVDVIAALSGQATTTNGLTDGTINGSSSTTGLPNGDITGTSGGASAGTAHTHSAGSYAVTNGQHSHTGGSYAVTNGQHSHDLPTV